VINDADEFVRPCPPTLKEGEMQSKEIIKQLHEMDYSKATEADLDMLLLWSSSKYNSSQHVRRIAMLKISLVLRRMPAETRKKCIDRLLGILEASNDTWQQHNILEALHSHTDWIEDDRIIAFLGKPHVNEFVKNAGLALYYNRSRDSLRRRL
jgi:hypothetical protein